MSKIFLLLCTFLSILNTFLTISVIRDRNDYSNSPMPKFIVNLDLPLKERYKNILPQFAPLVKQMLTAMKTNIKVKVISYLGRLVLFNQPKEYLEELKVISELMNISLSDLAINAITYELFSGCTSIILANKKREIIFGKNLDYDTANYLYKLSYQAVVFKDGQHIYDAVYVAGFVGVHLAHNVNNGVIISLNQRSNKSILYNIYRYWKGYLSPIYIIRKVMEKGMNYKEAAIYLNQVDISANCYFTVAGLKEGQGLVISKDVELNKSKINFLNIDQGLWFLVQTNYDRDIPDPLDDYRRVPVEEKMNNLGNDIDEQIFFENIMSKYPSNNNLTATTTVIKNNYFNSTLWTSGYDYFNNSSNFREFLNKK